MENMLLQQIFSIPLDGQKYLIYAPLKGIAFIANPSLVNAIFGLCQNINTSTSSLSGVSHNASQSCNKSPDNFDFIYQLGFFQPEPLPVDEYQDKGVQYDAVILFLTNQCNLRCSYCYASSGEYRKKQMPWEIAKASIDFVMGEVTKNRSPAMTLGFHGGGEPTLNWDILTRATGYVHSIGEEHNIRLHVTGSFNGYWSEKVTRYVIENFTEISLSFDGLPSVQNLQRPTVDKRDSFPRVVETLHSLDQAQFPYGIRMTVTNHSVSHLEESIALICENFRPRKIQVEPVFMEGRAIESKSAISDLNTFIDQFIKGCKKAEGHNIELFYSGARLEILTQRFCLASCRALVVTPVGDVTTCFETYSRKHPLSSQFTVGNYSGNGEFLIDEEKLHHHFRHTLSRIPYCDACFCKWHCAGDCAIKTFPKGAKGGFHPTERCLVNQELIKFLITKKIRESGGFIWVRRNSTDYSGGRKDDGQI